MWAARPWIWRLESAASKLRIFLRQREEIKTEESLRRML
jgi:hypothetical protein